MISRKLINLINLIVETNQNRFKKLIVNFDKVGNFGIVKLSND